MKGILKSILTVSLIIKFVLLISCHQTAQVISRSDTVVLPTPSNSSNNTAKEVKKDNVKTVLEESSNEEQIFLASDTCKKVKNKEERVLCNTIVKDNELENEGLGKEFSYLSRRLDLNNDGLKDAVVWINDRCGTSGCQFSFYKKTKKGFQRIFDELAWTPIIRLNSSNNEWYDVAYQVAGGGVEPHFTLLQYSGQSYKFKKNQKEQPDGKIILDKNWKQSIFGPLPTNKN